jgi:hypothetical protein
MSFEIMISVLFYLLLWTALSSAVAYFLARAFFGKPGKLDRDDNDL